jgi:hypothetical protein
LNIFFLSRDDFFFQDALIGEGITIFIVSDAVGGEKLHGHEQINFDRWSFLFQQVEKEVAKSMG